MGKRELGPRTGRVVTTTSFPPPPDAVLAALRRLPGAVSSPAAAVLHLATPVHVAVGVEARAANGWFTVRTHSVAALEPGLVEMVRAATAASAAAHEDGDEYLDLSGDPSTWVKVLRSGFRRVAFGADVLFGGPLTTVEDGVSDQDVRDWVRLWATGACSLPTVMPGGAIADGSPVRAVLRQHDRPPVEAPVGQAGPRALDRLAAQAVTRFGDQLGATHTTHERTGSRFPGTAGYVAQVSLPGWEGMFPLTVSSSTQLAGVPLGEVAPGPHALPVDLPVGFSVAGEHVSAEGLVVRHDHTGLVLMVRRAH